MRLNDLKGYSAEEIKAEIIKQGMSELSSALRYLGNGNASTQMGAIEAFGVVFKESAEQVSRGMESIAEAINNLADAVRETRET